MRSACSLFLFLEKFLQKEKNIQQDKSKESEESDVGCLVVFFVGLAIFCFFNPSCSCNKQNTDIPTGKVSDRTLEYWNSAIEIINKYKNESTSTFEQFAENRYNLAKELSSIAQNNVSPEVASLFNDYIDCFQRQGNLNRKKKVLMEKYYRYKAEWYSMNKAVEAFARGLVFDLGPIAEEQEARNILINEEDRLRAEEESILAELRVLDNRQQKILANWN